MPDSKVMEKYVNRILEHLGEEDLSKVEEVLGTKLHETRSNADSLGADINRMKETIRQAQERLSKLVDEYSDTLSKAAGITESLIALKFGDQIKKESEERENEEVKSKGNGSKDPSAPKKKKRPKRTRSSRATA